MNTKVMFSSASDNWSTPKDVYNKLNSEFGFDFDPCPLNLNPLVDGLNIEWGDCSFVNPPYSNISAWCKKAYEEYLKRKTVVMLIPSRTDTKYWHEYIMKASEIRFIKGRLIFGSDEYWAWVWEQEYINGKKNSLYKKYGKKHSAPFPSCIVVFRK